MRAVIWQGALAFMALLALAGCATSSTTRQTPVVIVTPTLDTSTATPGPSPTPQFFGTPGANAPDCQASQLSVSFVIDPSVAPGLAIEMGTLTNTSAMTCTIEGYPGVQLLDPQRNPQPTQVSHDFTQPLGGNFPLQRIQLMAGASSYVAVAWATKSSAGQAGCPLSGYLAVTPPNMPSGSGVVVGADPISACDGKLSVSPVQVAPFMSE